MIKNIFVIIQEDDDYYPNPVPIFAVTDEEVAKNEIKRLEKEEWERREKKEVYLKRVKVWQKDSGFYGKCRKRTLESDETWLKRNDLWQQKWSKFHDELCLDENYEILPSTIAQQTLKVVDRSFKSFFGLLKAKSKGKYQNRVSIPHYLNKNGYFQLIIPKNGFQIKGNKIQIGISRQLKNEVDIKNIVLDFPTQIDASKVKEVRIIPQQKAKFFKMEIVHEVEEQNLNLNSRNVLSIDLGLSNLATCYDVKNNRAFICDGRKIKSINHYWNKQNAKLQSIKDKQGIKNYTEKQFLLKRKRENRIKDSIRKSARYVINYCINNDIGTIVVGHNKGWKQEINIGKVNNQNFVQVPFGYLMSMLESKCEEFGLNYRECQESHTSKCSALDNEEVKHHDSYVGKRIKRGLFKSKTGLVVNADVNGAINIARKSKVTSMEVTPEMVMGIVAYPLRIRTI